jgi:hypothetical protein
MDQTLGAKPDLADAFTAIAENRAFELLLRYDARLQSTFQRSLRTLIQLREKLPAAEPLEDTAEPTLKAMAAITEPIFTCPLPDRRAPCNALRNRL